MLAIQLDCKVCFAAFLLLFAVWVGLPVCQAENHYCTRGHSVSMELDDFYHNDEILVPQQSTQCKWQFSINSKRKRLNFVLEGLPHSKDQTADDASVVAFELLVTVGERSVKDSATAGLFRVLPIDASTRHFSVELIGAANSSPIKLRVMLLPPNGCARDMLSFNGNCYAVSPVAASATAVMVNIKGAAQMASFISLTEVKHFIAANNAKLIEYPYKRPINLKQSVRLGMFYNPVDDTTLCATTHNGSNGCQCPRSVSGIRHEFRVSQPPTGPCATLNVDALDSPVPKFDDCKKPMPMLLSFPELSGSKESAGGVTCDVHFLQRRLPELERSFSINNSDAKNSSRQGKLGFQLNPAGASSAQKPASLITVAIIVAFMASVVIFAKYARGFCRSQGNICPSRGPAGPLTNFDVENQQKNRKPLLPSSAGAETAQSHNEDENSRGPQEPVQSPAPQNSPPPTQPKPKTPPPTQPKPKVPPPTQSEPNPRQNPPSTSGPAPGIDSECTSNDHYTPKPAEARRFWQGLANTSSNASQTSDNGASGKHH